MVEQVRKIDVLLEQNVFVPEHWAQELDDGMLWKSGNYADLVARNNRFSKFIYREPILFSRYKAFFSFLNVFWQMVLSLIVAIPLYFLIIFFLPVILLVKICKVCCEKMCCSAHPDEHSTNMVKTSSNVNAEFTDVKIVLKSMCPYQQLLVNNSFDMHGCAMQMMVADSTIQLNSEMQYEAVFSKIRSSVVNKMVNCDQRWTYRPSPGRCGKWMWKRELISISGFSSQGINAKIPMFDIDNHLKLIKLEDHQFGSSCSFHRWLGQLISTPLSPDIPLWQMIVLSNFGNARRVLVIFRYHVVYGDAVDLCQTLNGAFSSTASGAESMMMPLGDRKFYGGKVGPSRGCFAAPLTLMDYLSNTRDGLAASNLHQPVSQIAPSDDTAAVVDVPQWSIALSVPMDIACITAVRVANQVTMNEVLLSAVAGALRCYLQRFGVQFPPDMSALLQLDLRPPDSYKNSRYYQLTNSGNQKSRSDASESAADSSTNKSFPCLFPLPTSIVGAVPRLWHVKDRHRPAQMRYTSRLARGFFRQAVTMPLSTPDSVASWFRDTNRAAICYVQHVLGPNTLNLFERSEDDSRCTVASMAHVNPLPSGVPLSITMISYRGAEARISVVARRGWPDAGYLATEVVNQLKQIYEMSAARSVLGTFTRLDDKAPKLVCAMSNEYIDRLESELETIQAKVKELQQRISSGDRSKKSIAELRQLQDKFKRVVLEIQNQSVPSERLPSPASPTATPKPESPVAPKPDSQVRTAPKSTPVSVPATPQVPLQPMETSLDYVIPAIKEATPPPSRKPVSKSSIGLAQPATAQSNSNSNYAQISAQPQPAHTVRPANPPPYSYRTSTSANTLPQSNSTVLPVAVVGVEDGARLTDAAPVQHGRTEANVEAPRRAAQKAREHSVQRPVPPQEAADLQHDTVGASRSVPPTNNEIPVVKKASATAQHVRPPPGASAAPKSDDHRPAHTSRPARVNDYTTVVHDPPSSRHNPSIADRGTVQPPNPATEAQPQRSYVKPGAKPRDVVPQVSLPEAAVSHQPPINRAPVQVRPPQVSTSIPPQTPITTVGHQVPRSVPAEAPYSGVPLYQNQDAFYVEARQPPPSYQPTAPKIAVHHPPPSTVSTTAPSGDVAFVPYEQLPAQARHLPIRMPGDRNRRAPRQASMGAPTPVPHIADGASSSQRGPTAAGTGSKTQSETMV